MRHSAFAACCLGFALFVAGPAVALPIANGYTLDAPLHVVHSSGDEFTLNPVGSGATGLDPSFITCLDTLNGSTCDYGNQDWLIFTVTTDVGSLEELGAAAQLVVGEGLGYFTNSTGEAPDSGNFGVPSVPVFNFNDGNDGGLAAVTTSKILFVAYAEGTLPSDGGFCCDPGTVRFMVAPVGNASESFDTLATTPVPEPSTLALLGGGVLGLALGARRRR